MSLIEINRIECRVGETVKGTELLALFNEIANASPVYGASLFHQYSSAFEIKEHIWLAIGHIDFMMSKSGLYDDSSDKAIINSYKKIYNSDYTFICKLGQLSMLSGKLMLAKSNYLRALTMKSTHPDWFWVWYKKLSLALYFDNDILNSLLSYEVENKNTKDTGPIIKSIEIFRSNTNLEEKFFDSHSSVENIKHFIQSLDPPKNLIEFMDSSDEVRILNSSSYSAFNKCTSEITLNDENELADLSSAINQKKIYRTSLISGNLVPSFTGVKAENGCCYIFWDEGIVFYHFIYTPRIAEFSFYPSLRKFMVGKNTYLGKREIILELKKFFFKILNDFPKPLTIKQHSHATIMLNQERPFHFLFDQVGSIGITKKNHPNIFFNIDCSKSKNFAHLSNVEIVANDNEFDFPYICRRLPTDMVNKDLLFGIIKPRELSEVENRIAQLQLANYPHRIKLDTDKSKKPKAVWFGIAYEKRYCSNQIEGFIELYERYKDDIDYLFIDGLIGSTLGPLITNSLIDNALRNKELSIFEKIISSIGPAGAKKIIPTISLDINSKWTLLEKYNPIYILQVGTQSSIPSRIFKLPGIIHGNSMNINDMNSGQWKLHRDVATSTVLPINLVKDREDLKGLRAGLEPWEDRVYEIDWKGVIPILQNIMDKTWQ